MLVLGIALALAATLVGFAGLGMSGHMGAHMGAVAIAAPVLALSSYPRRRDSRRKGLANGSLIADFLEFSRRRNAGGGAPLGWAMIEFVVVWAWHAPMLRDLADTHLVIALVEQAMFLIVGVGLWRAAFAHPAAGVAALLLTSMHMTLLGALIGLASRPLYAMMAMHPAPGLDALADQEVGGVVMLVIGGAVYCLGGLALLGTLLRERATA